MSLVKVLVVEYISDPESEGLVLDRIVNWKDDMPLVLLGVHWLVPPKSGTAIGALDYIEVTSLRAIDVIDDVSELTDSDEEEEEEEEGEEHED